jgi:hypothetical protein
MNSALHSEKFFKKIEWKSFWLLGRVDLYKSSILLNMLVMVALLPS